MFSHGIFDWCKWNFAFAGNVIALNTIGFSIKQHAKHILLELLEIFVTVARNSIESSIKQNAKLWEQKKFHLLEIQLDAVYKIQNFESEKSYNNRNE